jgi:hypothetical protein
MAYKLDITWRVSATSHDRDETAVDYLADIGRVIADGAPDGWNAAYVVVTPITATAGEWLAHQASIAKGEAIGHSTGAVAA